MLPHPPLRRGYTGETLKSQTVLHQDDDKGHGLGRARALVGLWQEDDLTVNLILLLIDGQLTDAARGLATTIVGATGIEE